MKGTVRLSDLFARFHEKVQFLHVYIREAHPTDGWWLGRGLFGAMVKGAVKQASTDLRDPISIEERRAAASACCATLRHGIPTLVDALDDEVNKAYAAWPTRLYLIDLKGVVAYRGGPGPFGFSPRQFGAAIRQSSTTVRSLRDQLRRKPNPKKWL